MATLETIRKTRRVLEGIGQIINPYPLGPVLFDGKGIITLQTRGRNRGNWGSGILGKQRRRFGPGVLEKAYSELPKDMLVKFVLLTGESGPTPPRQEFVRFEKRLMETVRRILNQELKQRIGKLPRPVGRRERKEERTKLIRSVWKKYRAKKWSSTASTRQTALDLGCDRATVWRHLASRKH